MERNIKINQKQSGGYQTVCPKSRADVMPFDKNNTLTAHWGDYDIHNPLENSIVDDVMVEIEDNTSTFGKVVNSIGNIGDVIGMVGYGNMAIYVSANDTDTVKVYNVLQSNVTQNIDIPMIDGIRPVVQDIALVKLDKQTPEVALLCYVGSAIYYVSYDVLSTTALNNNVSYSLVGMIAGGVGQNIPSRFIRTKKEIVLLNGKMGKVHNTYGNLGLVMRSLDGDTFEPIDKIDGASDGVYLPINESIYCGDDIYSASIATGSVVEYFPIVFTIDDDGLNVGVQYTQSRFVPLGRDESTGEIMFAVGSSWRKIGLNGSVVNIANFSSNKTPTIMFCLNGLKISNAGYYYNTDGENIGKALADENANSISPTSSQQLLRLFRINDTTIFIYSSSTNKWYKTTI